MKHLGKSIIIAAIMVAFHISLFGQENAREVFTRATGQILTENMELISGDEY